MFSRSNICQSCIYESDLFIYIYFLLRSKMQPSETTDNMIRLQEEHHEYSRVAQRRVQRHRDAHGFFSRHLCGLRLKRQHARSSGYTLTSALKLLGSRIASLCVCVCGVQYILCGEHRRSEFLPLTLYALIGNDVWLSAQLKLKDLHLVFIFVPFRLLAGLGLGHLS